MNEPPRGSHKLLPEEIIRFKVKAELRKRMRGLRKTAPAEACAERSRAIVARLEAMPEVQQARSFALFWPIEAKHEVDLRSFDAALRARGASVSYPAIDPESHVMTFHVVNDVAELVERGFGFCEPSRDAPRVDLDVVIVPALVVDPTGHRIGYGAGYYDRALPTVAPPASAIAVAYDWQLVAEVPATEGDVRVSWIVTDTRTLSAG